MQKMTQLILCLYALSPSMTRAERVDIPLSVLPNGDPLADGSVLDDQYRSLGLLFDARVAPHPRVGTGVPLVGDGLVDPVKEFGGSLFFEPDVFRAVAILTFVTPSTDSLASVNSFSARTDPHFGLHERVELAAFDASQNEIATETFVGTSPTSVREVTIVTATPFSYLEIRTNGDPGIAFHRLAFERIPEPSSLLLLMSAASLVRWRHRYG